MDLPFPRLRFRFGRLRSTRTRVVFFAMNSLLEAQLRCGKFNKYPPSPHLIALSALTSTFGGNRRTDLFCRRSSSRFDENRFGNHSMDSFPTIYHLRNVVVYCNTRNHVRFFRH